MATRLQQGAGTKLKRAVRSLRWLWCGSDKWLGVACSSDERLGLACSVLSKDCGCDLTLKKGGGLVDSC